MLATRTASIAGASTRPRRTLGASSTKGRASESRTTSTACRTRRNTSSATGFAVEIKYESALRAANEIETGVPPAVGYENIYTTYMNKSRSYLLDDSKQIQEADGVRSQ